MYEFPLLYPERVADATIRGFLYQILWSTLHWLNITSDEVLLCEGDEDLDRCIYDGSVLRSTEQSQFKALAGRISIRDKEVYKSIFNFIISFQYHHNAGRSCVFVFTTTASAANQKTDKSNFPVKVLQTWANFSTKITTEDKKSLITSIKSAVATYKGSYAKKADGTSDPVKSQRLDDALAYLDNNSLWDKFLGSVRWQMDSSDEKGLRRKIIEKANEIDSLKETDERVRAILVARLVEEVLRKCCNPNPEDRLLTKECRDELLGLTIDALKEWAQSKGLATISTEILQIKKDIDGIKANVSDLQRRQPTTLSEVTRTSLRQLAQRAYFSINRSSIYIVRTASTDLLSWAQEGSCVIIGTPGIGKSAILYHLALELQNKGHVIVVTTVAKLLSHPHLVQEIQRSENAGFLLIDGLDAQRGERNSLYDAIEGLINEKTDWRIIASIRKFDLENDPRLQRMFLGHPHPEYCPAGPSTGQGIYRVRCFEIRQLDNNELRQIEAQSPEIASLIAQSSERLKDLLLNPFNLSIAAQLLDGGRNAQSVQTISTQVDLLDRYWDERLCEEPKNYRDTREALLGEICEKMMQLPALELLVSVLGRSLHLERLNDILLSGILHRNQEEDFVEFSHNILFDYAIARYWLKNASELGSVRQAGTQIYNALRRRLEQHGDLVLLVYPSLEMYFVWLWGHDLSRQSFWRCILELAASTNIRPVLLVAPAAVTSRMALSWADLEPLCSALASIGEVGHRMVQRVVTALASQPREDINLVGPSAGPWCQLAEWLAATGEPSLMDAARRLLWLLTPPMERGQDEWSASSAAGTASLTPAQQSSAHKAAIAYFDYIWAAKAPDIRLLESSIQLICKNMTPVPADVILRLRLLLAPQQIDAIGFVTIPAIARSLKWIFVHDMNFVVEFCIYAFRFRDTRQDMPVHRGGPVFGMQSNRKQDYESGLYALEKQFAQILNADPYSASLILCAIMNEREKAERARAWKFQREFVKSLNEQELPEQEPDPQIEKIEFESKIIRFQRDHSASSDRLSQLDSYEGKILDTWTQWLDKAISSNTRQEQIESTLSALIEHNSLERIWMRLLLVATRHANILGKRLLPIACAPSVFSSADRQKLVGLFIGKVWPLLSEDEQKEIEVSISSFVESTRPEGKNWAVHIRETLHSWIQNPTADAPSLPDPERWPEEAIMADDLSGEDISEPSKNFDKVKRWVDQKNILSLSRSPLSEASFAEIRADMAQLFGVLIAPHKQGEDGEESIQDEKAWGYLTAAAATLASRDDIMSQPGLFAELKRYLLAATHRITPSTERGEPLAADATLAWSFPTTRKDAAMGLCELARKVTSEDPEINSSVERLALNDQSSLVRVEIAHYAACIHQKQSAIHNSYLAHIQNAERSGAVVWYWMKSGVLWNIARIDIESALDIVERLVERFSSDAEVDEGIDDKPNRILGLARNYYAVWFINFSHSRLDNHIEEILCHPWSRYAQEIPAQFHEAVVYDLVKSEDRSDADNHTLRIRAWCLIELLCDSAYDTYVDLTNKKVPLTEVEKKNLLGIQHTLLNLARMAWHLLEAHAQERIRQGEQGVKLGSNVVRKGFFVYAQNILGKLAKVGIPSIADELIKALSGAIDFAPKEAILLAAESITNAVPHGLATDTFAEHTVGSFIRRYLTEQRSLLQGDKEARDALLQMLSPFVDMGWPEMQKLVFRLADAFR